VALARDLKQGAAMPGWNWTGWFVVIMDQHGHKVDEVPIADVWAVEAEIFWRQAPGGLDEGASMTAWTDREKAAGRRNSPPFNFEID
jgi:hypothetical protein